MPASDTSATRSPAAQRGSSSAVRGRLVVGVQGEQAGLDPVAVEQQAGVARVFGQDEVGRGQARRGRAASRRRGCRSGSRRRRAARPSSRAPRRRRGRRRSVPAAPPSSATASRTRCPAGASASRRDDGAHRLEQELARRDAEAAADDDDVGVEEVLQRGDRRTQVAADRASSGGWRRSTRSRAVAAGPSTSRATRSAAVPEQYDSTWPAAGAGALAGVRRPRRSPCGRARSSRGRACRRGRGRRRPRCRA